MYVDGRREYEGGEGRTCRTDAFRVVSGSHDSTQQSKTAGSTPTSKGSGSLRRSRRASKSRYQAGGGDPRRPPGGVGVHSRGGNQERPADFQPGASRFSGRIADRSFQATSRRTSIRLNRCYLSRSRRMLFATAVSERHLDQPGLCHPALRQPGPGWFAGRSTMNFLLPAALWCDEHWKLSGG